MPGTLLETTRDPRVLQIALNRPEKRNALNVALCRELADALDAADADATIGAIVLRGNGPAFCAGMDLREALETDPQEAAALHERLFTAINRLRKPLIAAIEGPALAGGTGLAANAHIVVAAPGATFGLTEIRIGLWPVLVFRACLLAMGERRTTELSITGRVFSAAEAWGFGLVSEIAVEPLPRALEIAAQVSRYSANVLAEGLQYARAIRSLAWDEAGKTGQELRARLMAHPDFKAGVSAFQRSKART